MPTKMALMMKPKASKVLAKTSSRPTQAVILVRVARSSAGSSSLCTMGVGRMARYSRPRPIRPSINSG
ncbi:hypothetical protein D3C76_1810960 [compost metagenome]